MSKPPPESPSPEELVAAALNEQGFLFSQLIRETIRFGVSGKGKSTPWDCVTAEYPVTASDGCQTRIDIVLRHSKASGVHVCLECKRANPLFKRWVFFDKTYLTDEAGGFYFECYRNPSRPANLNTVVQGIVRRPTPTGFGLFQLYVEAAVNRAGKAGATQTIEDALLQVIQGQTGLMAKQPSFTGPSAVLAIPVIVTTAQLFEAQFDPERVSCASGEIAAKDLKLEPLEYCAVNYHPNDELSASGRSSGSASGNIEEDVMNWQTRTVFVVHAESVIRFLNWLGSHFADFA